MYFSRVREDEQDRHNQRYNDDHIEDGQHKDENWEMMLEFMGQKVVVGVNR